MKLNFTHPALAAVVLSVGLVPANAATVLSESLGIVTTTTTIAAHESAGGFDNDALTFSGTADLRATTSSAGTYAGASGGANAFLADSSSTAVRIDGISTMGYNVGSVGITFGAFKSLIAPDMTTLVLEFSTDGSNWTMVGIPSQPTGAGTAIWRLISIPNTSIPISSTLSLRWTNTDLATDYRIDDITLSAVPEPAAAVLVAAGFLGLLRRRRHHG